MRQQHPVVPRRLGASLCAGTKQSGSKRTARDADLAKPAEPGPVGLDGRMTRSKSRRLAVG